MAHVRDSSEPRWSRSMMWLAQGRARHARCRDRPIAARVSASAARKDHTFGQTALLSTAIRGKAKRQYDVTAERGAYQSVAINGVFDACCASASSVQLLWHARICLPRNLDRRANLLFFVRCGGSSQSGFADNRLYDPSSCRARGQCRAKQNVQCGK